MNIGIVVLAHNAVSHMERLLMSIHGQFFTNWHLYIVDIESTDRVEEILESLRYKPTFGEYYTNRNCDIFKDKINYYQIKHNQDEFQHVLREVLAPNPMNHMVTFIPANWKFNGNVLEQVAKFPAVTTSLLSLSVQDYNTKENLRPLYLYRRFHLENSCNSIPLVLVKDELRQEYRESFTHGGTISPFGRASYITAFSR